MTHATLDTDALFKIHPAKGKAAPMAEEVTAYLVVERHPRGWVAHAVLIDAQEALAWASETPDAACVVMLPYETAWSLKRAGFLTERQAQALRDMAVKEYAAPMKRTFAHYG